MKIWCFSKALTKASATKSLSSIVVPAMSNTASLIAINFQKLFTMLLLMPDFPKGILCLANH
jgi:hypothetical protein